MLKSCLTFKSKFIDLKTLTRRFFGGADYESDLEHFKIGDHPQRMRVCKMNIHLIDLPENSYLWEVKFRGHWLRTWPYKHLFCKYFRIREINAKIRTNFIIFPTKIMVIFVNKYLFYSSNFFIIYCIVEPKIII